MLGRTLAKAAAAGLFEALEGERAGLLGPSQFFD